MMIVGHLVTSHWPRLLVLLDCLAHSSHWGWGRGHAQMTQVAAGTRDSLRTVVLLY